MNRKPFLFSAASALCLALPACGGGGMGVANIPPDAEELISTWTAPFRNPETGQDSIGFGVWIGKKP